MTMLRSGDSTIAVTEVFCGEIDDAELTSSFPLPILCPVYRAMQSQRSLLALTKYAGHLRRLNGSRATRYRGMATEAAMLDPKLPLAGIRVLDMTRVLAGVRGILPALEPNTADLSAAILYTNPWRPRVGASNPV